MPDANKPHSSSLWLGLGVALAAMLCNFVVFLNPPAQSAIPWLSLILGVVALAFIALGAKNLFVQHRSLAAKIMGTLVVLLSVLLSAGSIFGFFEARAVPPSTDAPQVGEKAPDFTLPDTKNHAVSLAQLLASTSGNSTAAAPQAVLLVFYRGYW